jgi:hypothetical protein
VHALRRIHAALVPGGVVVDTQPVSPRPPVTTPAGELGTLDMRGWAGIVDAVDERVALAVDEGLFAIATEPSFVVADTFDSGPAVVETVKNWQGTTIPRPLGARLAEQSGVVRVHQEVRLRLLRAL